MQFVCISNCFEKSLPFSVYITRQFITSVNPKCNTLPQVLPGVVHWPRAHTITVSTHRTSIITPITVAEGANMALDYVTQPT